MVRLAGLRLAADVHLAWSQEGLYLALLGSNYLDFELLADPSAFPLDEAFQVQLAVDAGHGVRQVGVHLVPRRSQRYPDRLEVEPELYRYTAGRPAQRLPTAGRVQQLAKPLPHIGLEMFVPAAELGCEQLAPGARLRLNVSVVGYHRERVMTWTGPPDPRTTPRVLRTVILH